MRTLLAEHRRFVWMYLALAPVYLAPLLVTPFLPGFDLPHHLSVVDALVKANRPDSPYARDFVVGFALTPFAVHFVALWTLAHLMSVAVAAKVLVGAVVLALPLVTARLLAVFGRDIMPALLAFALAYSMPLHYGLIAFVVALPFLVWTVAEASNEAGWRERPMRTALIVGVLSLVSCFAHLEAWAFAVAAAFVAIMLGSVSWRSRALVIAAVFPSLMLCVLFLFRTAAAPQFSAEPSFVRALIDSRVQEFDRGVLYDLASRMRGLPIHLLRGFNDGSDVVAANVFFGLIVAGMLVGVATWATRVPRVRLRLTAVGGLVALGLAAYLGLPHHVYHAHSIYPRFDVVLALLLLLTVPASFSSWVKQQNFTWAALAALLLSVWGLNLTSHYAAFGRELADFEQVISASPSGLRSGGLVFDAESAVMNVGGIFTSVPVYYVTERAAPRSSTWLYYCTDPQFPCRMRNPERKPPLPHFSFPSEFDARRWIEDLDLVLVRGGPPAEKIFGSELPRVRLVAENGRWRAYARR